MTTTDPAIQAQAAAILAELLAPVDTIDPAPVTMATLRERLPAALYGELRLSFIRAKALATSEAPADQIFAEEIADTQAALAGGGFILHTPERLALLDQMAPALGWSAYLLAAMLRVCIITRPRWQTEGRPAEPTLETVAAELAAAALADRWRRVAIVVEDRFAAGEIADWSDVLAIAQGATNA